MNLKFTPSKILALISSFLIFNATATNVAASKCSKPSIGVIERDINELIYSDIEDLKKDYCDAVVWGKLNLEMDSDEMLLLGIKPANAALSAGACRRYSRTIKNVLRKEHSLAVEEADCDSELRQTRDSVINKIGPNYWDIAGDISTSVKCYATNEKGQSYRVFRLMIEASAGEGEAFYWKPTEYDGCPDSCVVKDEEIQSTGPAIVTKDYIKYEVPDTYNVFIYKSPLRWEKKDSASDAKGKVFWLYGNCSIGEEKTAQS